MKTALLWLKGFVDKLPHWLIVVLAMCSGAVFSYFQVEPNAQILAALTSWAVALPMLKGAGVAFAGTLIALLKTAPWSESASGEFIERKGPDGTVSRFRKMPPLAVFLVGSLMSLMTVIVLSTMITVSASCTPAETAAWDKVRDIVVAQLKNGAALSAIETAIAAYVPAGADVDAIINEVIQGLHDLNELPPDVLPVATARQQEIAAMPLASHRRVGQVVNGIWSGP